MCTLAPALRAIGADVTEGLKEGSQSIARGNDRFRSALVVAGGRLLRSSMTGVEPLNLAFLCLACGMLVAIGVAAASIPATRAASIDPIKALHSD
jgi:hypothetical protein